MRLGYGLRMCVLLVIVTAVMVAALPVAAQGGVEPTHADVAYVPDGDPTKQVLDIYLPADATGSFPTVFMIHCNGCSKWDYKPQAARLAEQGYATVSIEYRNGSLSAPLSAVEDAFCALAWIHDEGATYGLDSDRVVVFGHSLGGYLAAMLGTVDEPERFLEACPYALPDDRWMAGTVVYAGALTSPAGGLVSEALGIENPDEMLSLLADRPVTAWREENQLPEAAVALASILPRYWVDGSEAPFLIFHGERDTLVPVDLSSEFASTLEAAGVDVELVIVTRGGHGIRLYQRVPTPQVDDAFEAFLARVFATD